MKKYCCTCKWYAEYEGVCCNGKSEHRADFRCLDDTCEEWEQDADNLEVEGQMEITDFPEVMP